MALYERIEDSSHDEAIEQREGKLRKHNAVLYICDNIKYGAKSLRLPNMNIPSLKDVLDRQYLPLQF